MKQMYGKLLPFVRHRADLNYLMDMMKARSRSDIPMFAAAICLMCPIALAGCLEPISRIDNGRYKIPRIFDNENWNPDLRSPLSHSPGSMVNTGEYILAVNGVEQAPDNIYRLLDGTANRQVQLTVNDKPTMNGSRNVTVVPVANERKGIADKGLGRVESTACGSTFRRAACVCIFAKHRTAWLCEL